MAGQKIGDAFIDIGARFDKLNKGLKQTTSKIESGFSKLTPKLDKQFVNLGKTFAAAFATREIINFTTEAVKLAATAEGVERAFKRLNDPDLLSNLQKATRGTVSELDLMKQAVQGKNLGVPIENLASLFAFATQRAADTGEEVSHLVQSITVGIGRKSPLILDNLGISAIALRKALGGVSQEAATVGDVAAAVGKIAEENLSSIGETSLTSAQKLARLTAGFDNLKVSVGEGLITAFDGALKGFERFFNESQFMVEQLEKDPMSFGFAKSNLDEFLYDIRNFSEKALAIEKERVDAEKRLNEALLKAKQAITDDGTEKRAKEAAILKQYLKLLDLEAAKYKKLEEAPKTVEEITFSVAELQEQLKALKTEQLNAKDYKEWSKWLVEIEKVNAELKKIQQPNVSAAGALDSKATPSLPGIQGGAPELMGITSPEDQKAMDAANEKLVQMTTNLENVAFAQQAASTLVTQFGMALTDSFVGALDGSANFFESIGEYIKGLIIQLAAAAAVAGILTAILSGSTGGLALLKNLGDFKGLFGNFSGLGLDFGGTLRGHDIWYSNDRAGQGFDRTLGAG